MKLRLSGITDDSVVDGPGIRLAVFAQGCPHNCPGCHNPLTHDFNGGFLVDVDEIVYMMDNNPLLDGVTFTGGEPFMQAAAFAVLAEKAAKKGLHVMAYTGYTWDELTQDEKNIKLLEKTDLLVDGRFEIGLKTLNIPYIGSSNQRIINAKEMIKKPGLRGDETRLRGDIKLFLK